jgi:putative transposase
LPLAWTGMPKIIFRKNSGALILKTHHIISSMSAVGSCYDNAVEESFFGSLKREHVNRRKYATHAEAKTDIFGYIERFDNQ